MSEKNYPRVILKIDTDNLFLAEIENYPIVDVFIHDEHVELSGLIPNKCYNDLTLYLQYVNKEERFRITQFTAPEVDDLSNYISNFYYNIYNIYPEESFFKAWYGSIFDEEFTLRDYIEYIVLKEDFLEKYVDKVKFTKFIYFAILDVEIEKNYLDMLVTIYDTVEEDESIFEAKKSVLSFILNDKKFKELENSIIYNACEMPISTNLIKN